MRLSAHSRAIFTFLAFAGFFSQVSSSSIPLRRSESATRIFQRDEKNCKEADPRLPENFKCTLQDSKCISLDDGSSAICCVDSQDCKNISPIACDIRKQNVTAFPNSAVWTTALSRNLPTCGQNCCPFGYDCITPTQGDAFCSLIVSRSSLAETKEESSSSSAASASTTATSTSRSTSSSSSAAATTANLSSSIDSNKTGSDGGNPFPPGVFLAGLFPGMVVGALLLLAWVIYSGRHKTPNPSGSRRQSGSSHRPIISDPIPMTGGVRSDFARRFQDRLSRAKSTFSHENSRADSNPWKNPTPPLPNNIPTRPNEYPETPKNKISRDPDLESIRIYSPPNMVQHPSATVPPLRTTSAQRRPSSPTFGSPFTSPLKANGAYEYVGPMSRDNEVLGSQRYEAETQRHELELRESLHPRRKDTYGGDESNKRDTSFTALMHHCNIPDRGDEFPVPKVPKPYETRL